MKKTKIIATIGPNSNNKETIREMVLSGCDVIRINLSHASSKFCDNVIDLVREVERELNIPIGIMLDTNGPSVRLDEIKEEKLKIENQNNQMLEEITQEKESIQNQKRQMLDEVNTEKQKVSDMRNELQKEREELKTYFENW